jgi:hypothetical protein
MSEPVPGVEQKRQTAATDPIFIGCPLDWFLACCFVLQGKSELAVGLLSWRLQFSDCCRLYEGEGHYRGLCVSFSNQQLPNIPGVERQAKYRTLKKLHETRLITLLPKKEKEAPVFVFHPYRAKEIADIEGLRPATMQQQRSNKKPEWKCPAQASEISVVAYRTDSYHLGTKINKYV